MQLMIIVACIIVFVFLFILFGKQNANAPKVLYKDTGPRSRVFINKRYGIAAKPDAILQTPDGIVGVEYKSRRHGIYLSDIVEAKAAALAARSKYRICAIQIKNQTQSKVFPLPKNDADLYNEIKHYKELADAAQHQLLHAEPHPAKCRACPVNRHCSERLG